MLITKKALFELKAKAFRERNDELLSLIAEIELFGYVKRHEYVVFVENIGWTTFVK